MNNTVASRAALLRARAEEAAGALPPLILTPRPVTANAALGEHGLRRPGTGEDFWQYRPASTDDSPARIDWRRSARGDLTFVRDRERQTSRTATLWLGRGAGMGYSGQVPGDETKLDRGRLIALSLALSMLRGGERVAMLGETPGSGMIQAEKLSFTLAAAEPLPTDDDSPESSKIQSGQTYILIDDFLHENNNLNVFLGSVSDAGANGIMLQILHPDEETFPFAGAVRFETPGGLCHETRDAEGLWRSYQARLQERRSALATLALRSNFIFGTHDLSRPASGALIWLYGVLAGR